MGEKDCVVEGSASESVNGGQNSMFIAYRTMGLLKPSKALC